MGAGPWWTQVLPCGQLVYGGRHLEPLSHSDPLLAKGGLLRAGVLHGHLCAFHRGRGLDLHILLHPQEYTKPRLLYGIFNPCLGHDVVCVVKFGSQQP